MRILLLFSLILGLLVLPCAASAASLPLRDIAEAENRFYENPLPVPGIGDPAILYEDGKYYLFATGGTAGFIAWISPDMKTWDDKVKAMKLSPWASRDYWAPEVYKVDDRYVMLYTARRASDASLRIGIAFADAPEGPYEDALGEPLFDFGYAAIDAHLFFDADDIPYMYYSRDCSENIVDGNHESHIYAVQLAGDLLSTVGEPVLLAQPDTEWELQSGDYRWNEGAWVLGRDGKYYLFYSANYYAGKEYMVGVAVADHPLGPFVKPESNPLLRYIEQDGEVLVSGPGHNSFFAVGDELFTAYHTHTFPDNPSGNRQLNIDRAGFHADGSVYLDGPTREPRLPPLSQLGVRNAAPEAQGDGLEPLTDGDTCYAESSAAYAWQGSEFTLTWEEPILADMILLYPKNGEKPRGNIILNDEWEIPIGGGEYRWYFEAMEITSLRCEFGEEASIGEIIVLAQP